MYIVCIAHDYIRRCRCCPWLPYLVKSEPLSLNMKIINKLHLSEVICARLSVTRTSLCSFDAMLINIFSMAQHPEKKFGEIISRFWQFDVLIWIIAPRMNDSRSPADVPTWRVCRRWYAKWSAVIACRILFSKIFSKKSRKYCAGKKKCVPLQCFCKTWWA